MRSGSLEQPLAPDMSDERMNRKDGSTLARLLGRMQRAVDGLTRLGRECSGPPSLFTTVSRRIVQLRREAADVERLIRLGRTEIPPYRTGTDPEGVDAGSSAQRIRIWEEWLQSAIEEALDDLPMGPAKDLVVRAYVSSKDSQARVEEHLAPE